MKVAYSLLIACAGVVAACSTSATETGQAQNKPTTSQGAANAAAKAPAEAPKPAGQADAVAAPANAVTAVPAAAPLAPTGATQPAIATTVAATPAATTASATNVVTFHILAGTGSKAWNSAETPIPLQAGQTLQVVNDDSVMHWIHTDGAPFFHPFSGIAPGATASYKAGSKFSGKLHDHLTYGMIYLGDK